MLSVNKINRVLYGLKVVLMSWYLQLKIGNKKEKTVFIVAIHGSLHLLQLCVHYIPLDIQIIVIANDLTNFERKWISQKLRFSKIINIPRALDHGAILDILIFAIKDSFCTMDYDCFVLDDSLWENMFGISEINQCNAYFSDFNQDLNLDIPHTCYLTLNTRIYRHLIKKYKIGCNLVRNFDILPSNVKLKLKEVGVDKYNLPEKHKVFFDTLKMLNLLGIAENYPIDYRGHLQNYWKEGQEIFHVGGTSYWQLSKDGEALQGRYFWYRALALQPDESLKTYYENEFPIINTEAFEQRIKESNEDIQEGFESFCDQIIKEGYYSNRLH